ncbi:WcaI family glycosyltransferase [Mucilaginibacter sp. RS28]|uniref:WcaI family glycosyltransferase n=1 Tax=Mucilaginibacter straminoryzae TaxID=2932774 RepID=A0A9X2B9Y0_9SPHI|nr:WcaI family glycosyltransferase [Mucilaginibacter straminoryzae]MCJ8210225.1 WcaI family glycosyltransferase [Mucilaginibacter straminoryzae]
MAIKKVLLISHNFYPEPTGIGKYNGEMIAWMAANGYHCTVITTFPYYPYWKIQKPYKGKWYKKEVIRNQGSLPVTVYRCPSYVPSDPTGKQRMIQDISFWTSKLWQIFRLIIFNKKFDLIITVAPPFHLAYLGFMVRKFTGGKLVYHIQDLQIEAAQELNILSNKTMFKRLYSIEKKILRRADFVSSISDGMIKRIEEKIEDKNVLFFPNWADTHFFSPLPNREQLKQKWGFSNNDKVYLYSGAIGEKQGLENIILAAEQLKDDDQIKFVICGSGPYKEKLIGLAGQKGLKSITFLPVQEKNVFNEFLNMADFHLVLQKSNAGDLVMPSKLTTILAVGGVSIVTSSPGTSLFDVVKKYDVGYLIEPDSYMELARVVKMVKTDEDAERKRAHSREYAMKYLNIDQVISGFIENVSSKQQGKIEEALEAV